MNRWVRVVAGRLRFKVLCAALGVVVIACISGWVGLRYTNTVTTSVTDTTQIYLPLLTKAVDASNAMRSLSARAHGLLLACQEADRTHGVFLSGSMNEDFAVIEDLAAFLHQVGVRQYEIKVRSAKDELFHAFRNLGTICDTQAVLQREYVAQLNDATGVVTRLNALIGRLRADYRQRLSRGRALANASGDPEDDPYASRTALQILELMSARLGEISNGLLHSRSNMLVNGGARIVRQNEAVIKALAAERRALGAILRRDGNAAESKRLAGQFEALSRVVLGPNGIHDIWKRTRLFYSGTIITRMALTRADIALASALSGMEDEARTRYRQALAKTGSAVDEARWAVSTVTVLVAVVLLMSGWLLAARLTRPIERLKAFVMQLRRSEQLSQAMPAQLLDRKDEIGALAHSFNDLIVDLAEARQRLLSESRERIRTQYERLSAAIESIPQGLCLIDADDRLLMTNSRFMALYDLKPEDVRQGTPLDHVMEACRARGARPISRDGEGVEDDARRFSAFQGKPLVLNFRNQRTILVRTARTPEGGLVSVHEDITERRRQEQQIAHLAYHDTLTGLANRRLFRDTFGKLLAELKEPKEVALLYMDLDLFKTVNDTLGHPVGDQLLVAVAGRLQSCLRDTDRVARVGGDEFAMMLTDAPTAEEAARISARIIDKIGLPYEIDGQTIVIGVSVGIAISPRDGRDPDRLMKCADMALYRAKGDGRNKYHFFEPEMGARLQARRTLEMELRKVLDEDGLDLAYQPQVDIAEGRIEGFEALLRWRHKERGFITPEQFVPIAEETGLITVMGRWVLMQACREAATWPDSIRVGVNISPVQFRARTLVADVEAALSASGIAPHRLELEITEGILLQDTTANLETLEALRWIGVHIAMDDFGTGYSSLGYIRRFRFDRIKIDKSFVRDVVSSQDSHAVVHAVCSLCSTLGIKSVAEGVEDEAQLEILKREGCSLVQGYYIARPMAAADARELIASRKGPLSGRPATKRG